MHQCAGRYSRSQQQYCWSKGMCPVFDIQIPPPSLKRTQRGNELPIEDHLSPEPISPVRPKSVGPKATHRRGDVVRQDNGRGRLSCFFSMKKKRKRKKGPKSLRSFIALVGSRIGFTIFLSEPKSVRPSLRCGLHFKALNHTSCTVVFKWTRGKKQ